jgi:hypothetical protein
VFAERGIMPCEFVDVALKMPNASKIFCVSEAQQGLRQSLGFTQAFM